jgi:hypothetical protein
MAGMRKMRLNTKRNRKHWKVKKSGKGNRGWEREGK